MKYVTWNTSPCKWSMLKKSSIIKIFERPFIVCEVSEVAQSCPTLCNPVDCSLPGFSVHGILQARVLEWVAISFSRGSSQPRDRTQVFHNGGRCFNLWATREYTLVHIREKYRMNLILNSMLVTFLKYMLKYFSSNSRYTSEEVHLELKQWIQSLIRKKHNKEDIKCPKSV